MKARTCVIFGGTGCIGTHLAAHLLQNGLVECIYLADIRPIRLDPYTRTLLNSMEAVGASAARVVYAACDVRQPIGLADLPRETDLIVNLAAVHREPGHKSKEYYETNLPGARHVCDYASRSGCRQIVFTSSIAPYGSSDAVRNEDSAPMPETPYGGSKMIAEKIHLEWQQAEPERRLIVLRPGVVFGPGEHANVARLARSLARGYFVYMGNRSTRKAAVYVKELCSVVEFALDRQETSGERNLMWNVSMDPPPTLEEFVEAICAASGYRRPWLSVPRNLVVAGSYPAAGIARLIGSHLSIDPVRVRKVAQPTHIEPLRMREAGYQFRYTLERAISDWRRDAPEDF